MPGLGSFGRLGGGVAAVTAKAVQAATGSTGTLLTLTRFFGSTSTIALLSGSDANLALFGATISAKAALGSGVTQTATVRETLGQLAVEYPVTISTAAGSPSFSMSQLPASRIYQRSTTTGGGQSKGQGAIPVTINVTAMSQIQARVRSATDGTTILQSAFNAGTTTSTGTQTLNVSGIDARLGWFYLDLNDGSGWQLGTSKVGMGRVVAVSGQSLAVRMFGRMDGQTTTLASLNVAPSVNSSVYATYIDGQRTLSTPAWATPADSSNYDSSFAAEFLRLEVAAAGVNCALVGHSDGGQPITVFVPGGAQNPQLRTILSAVGGFESFIWMQGHNDAGTGMSNSTYQGYLTQLFNDLTAYNGVRSSSYEKLLCTIPNIASTSYGTYAQKQVIRQAGSAWAGSNSGRYVDMRDLAMNSDGIHPSMTGCVTMARHFYRATRSYLVSGANDDTGSTIASATRASGSSSVSLAIGFTSGATAISAVGSPETRFAVYAAGDLSSPLALASSSPIVVSATGITLNLASAPADSVALDVHFCPSPDPAVDGGASMIYDNNTSGSDGLISGRQLQATLNGPVTASAPAAATAVTKVGPDLVASGTPAYTSRANFGQAWVANGAFAYSNTGDGTDVLPTAQQTYTLEAWFSIASAPSAIKVIAGMGGRCWLGVNAQGRIVGEVDSYASSATSNYINGSSPNAAGTNPVVTDGAWHHAALVVTPTTQTLYLDGKSVGSMSTTPSNTNATRGAFNIATLNANSSFAFTGSIDEVAFWSGTARYTANFTAPTAAYTGKETGLTALWHLDGGVSAATHS